MSLLYGDVTTTLYEIVLDRHGHKHYHKSLIILLT